MVVTALQIRMSYDKYTLKVVTHSEPTLFSEKTTDVMLLLILS